MDFGQAVLSGSSEPSTLTAQFRIEGLIRGSFFAIYRAPIRDPLRVPLREFGFRIWGELGLGFGDLGFSGFELRGFRVTEG